MRVRIRIPGLESAAADALERSARLFLGRYLASIDTVEITLTPETHGGAEHTECELVVKLRRGGSIRVHDDRDHLQRALLRAAWRIGQRRELARLRDGAAPSES